MLPAIKDLADATTRKINEIMDALLCELSAATLPCDDRGVDIPVQDALENRVHKDGDTMTGKLIIQSDLEVTQNVGIGTPMPVTKLHVFGNSDTSLTTHGLLVLGQIKSNNISMDANEIMARNNNAVAPLFLNHEGGAVIINGKGADSLNVGTDSDFEARVNVNGTVKMSGFKLTTSPQASHVLTSNANGMGTWQAPSPFGWKVVNNDLVLNEAQITGNVGIKTETPLTPLQVNGSLAVGSGFTPNASNTQNIINLIVGTSGEGSRNGIAFCENASGFGMKIGYDGVGGGSSNAIRFYSDKNSALLSIENGGNLEASGKIRCQNARAHVSQKDVISVDSSTYIDMAGMHLTIVTANNPVLVLFKVPTIRTNDDGWCFFRLLVNNQEMAVSHHHIVASPYETHEAVLTWMGILAAGTHEIKGQWRKEAGSTITACGWGRQLSGPYTKEVTRHLIAIEL